MQKSLKSMLMALGLALTAMSVGSALAQQSKEEAPLRGLAYSEAVSSRLSAVFVEDMKGLGVHFVRHDKPLLPLSKGSTTVITDTDKSSFKSDTMRNVEFNSWRNVIDLRGSKPRVYMSTLPEDPAGVRRAVKVFDRVLLSVNTATREDAERRQYRATGNF